MRTRALFVLSAAIGLGPSAAIGLGPSAVVAQEIASDSSAVVVASRPLADAAELRSRLSRLLEDPSLTRAHVGLVVQVAETGEILFERDGERRFTPASNTKIVTAAVALRELGPGYRWWTRLIASGPIRDSELDGSLWVIGGGDPRLKRSALARWVGALRQAGIRHISGDVIGDDRLFEPPQWGIGWMWDDLYAGWAAGVTGLQVHPSSARGWLQPGPLLGDPATLRFATDVVPIRIATRVRTGPPDSEVRLRFRPSADGGPVELWGWVPANADSIGLFLAAEHPTPYLLEHLARAFADSGISVGGSYRRAHGEEMPEDSTWGAAFESDSLGAVLAELLKPSDNQIAESILRTIGSVEGTSGSDTEGLAVVQSTLAEWGIEPGAIDLSDGSGLSRYNEVTPMAMTRLLRAMWRHPDHAVWLEAMPIGAIDGTLRARMVGTPAAGNVRAKTGSLTSVRALSGYLTDGDGETIVFSLLLNGYDSPGDVAVAIEDLIVEQLALYHRPIDVGWPQFRTGTDR